ncbi:DUF2232 domain-containing protein [Paenibacillus turpanensis]|uniref:DUF2232 domain-containing protein n=1 Tax=Paenibacillus turpanensis TaxID=2689078 RepID=UPI00140AD1F0|nr:DUF2232 domain-containing protein [Paenibacillus turpanensis]
MFKQYSAGVGWSFLYLVMLLGVYIPLLQFIPLALLMVPTVILAVKLETIRFWVHYFVVMIVLYLLLGVYAGPLAVVSLLFIVPSYIMGRMYKRNQPARSVITTGIVSIIGVSLLALLLTSAGGINITKEFANFMHEGIQTFPNLMKTMLTEQQLNEYVDQYVTVTVRMLPFLIIIGATVYSFLTHGVVRLLQRRSNPDFPKLQPLREWRLPKSIVWYYLIALFLELIFRNADTSSLMFTILVNLIPLLMLAFAVQAIGFVFFAAHVKGWGRLLPIGSIILLLIAPFLMTIYSILGVFDVVMPLRERMQK